MATKAEYEATKTTMETVTREQVETLRRHAGEAGDGEMVEICDLALSGMDRWAAGRSGAAQKALRSCVEAINDAEAQA